MGITVLISVRDPQAEPWHQPGGGLRGQDPALSEHLGVCPGEGRRAARAVCRAARPTSPQDSQTLVATTVNLSPFSSGEETHRGKEDFPLAVSSNHFLVSVLCTQHEPGVST